MDETSDLEFSDFPELNAHFTDRRWWALCDAGGGHPVRLDATTGKQPSFVYDRTFGLYVCGMGYHQSIMSLLLAWHHGLNCGVEVGELLNVPFSEGTADAFLQRPGTAFKSSQSDKVEAWSPRHLEDWEVLCFGIVRYLKA